MSFLQLPIGRLADRWGVAASRRVRECLRDRPAPASAAMGHALAAVAAAAAVGRNDVRLLLPGNRAARGIVPEGRAGRRNTCSSSCIAPAASWVRASEGWRWITGPERLVVIPELRAAAARRRPAAVECASHDLLSTAMRFFFSGSSERQRVRGRRALHVLAANFQARPVHGRRHVEFGRCAMDLRAQRSSTSRRSRRRPSCCRHTRDRPYPRDIALDQQTEDLENAPSLER